MKGFSQRVSPIYGLTKKGTPWIWSQACEEASCWVKKSLQNAPVLAYPDTQKPFALLADDSGFGMGAILSQEGHPIAYESAKFSPAELNYTTGEKELLAIVHSLRTLRCYLEGAPHPIQVFTDHQPLTYLPTKGTLGNRQIRWAQFLSRFDPVCPKCGRSSEQDAVLAGRRCHHAVVCGH
jgi:hypothetical protein